MTFQYLYIYIYTHVKPKYEMGKAYRKRVIRISSEGWHQQSHEWNCPRSSRTDPKLSTLHLCSKACHHELIWVYLPFTYTLPINICCRRFFLCGLHTHEDIKIRVEALEFKWLMFIGRADSKHKKKRHDLETDTELGIITISFVLVS